MPRTLDESCGGRWALCHFSSVLSVSRRKLANRLGVGSVGDEPGGRGRWCWWWWWWVLEAVPPAPGPLSISPGRASYQRAGWMEGGDGPIGASAHRLMNSSRSGGRGGDMMRNEPRFERLLRSKRPGRCPSLQGGFRLARETGPEGCPLPPFRVNRGVSKAGDHSLFPVFCASVGRVPPIATSHSARPPSCVWTSQGRLGGGGSLMFGNVRVR